MKILKGEWRALAHHLIPLIAAPEKGNAAQTQSGKWDRKLSDSWLSLVKFRGEEGDDELS